MPGPPDDSHCRPADPIPQFLGLFNAAQSVAVPCYNERGAADNGQAVEVAFSNSGRLTLEDVTSDTLTHLAYALYERLIVR